MQWWCSAQGIPWTWTWRPYVGVWLLVLALAAGWVWLARGTPGARLRSARGASFAAGLACLWAGLDWPLGALAAGYLASAHMLQFLLVGAIAPPLLLLGVPPAAYHRLSTRPAVLAAVHFLTHPLVAILIFNGVVAFTHWPRIVDGLMGSQAGSFAIDMLWFAAGLIFWWPVVCPVPARPGFGYPLKIGYLIVNTIASTAPFLYLTFTRLPVYATYELAPPIEWITKREDQQLAGILMKVGGGIVLWVAITILFFRWYHVEESGPAPGRAPYRRFG